MFTGRSASWEILSGRTSEAFYRDWATQQAWPGAVRGLHAWSQSIITSTLQAQAPAQVHEQKSRARLHVSVEGTALKTGALFY